MFTSSRYFEVDLEIQIWKKLGARFVKEPEINKWKGMLPSLELRGDKPNEVSYLNHWWYIIGERDVDYEMIALANMLDTLV